MSVRAFWDGQGTAKKEMNCRGIVTHLIPKAVKKPKMDDNGWARRDESPKGGAYGRRTCQVMWSGEAHQTVWAMLSVGDVLTWLFRVGMGFVWSWILLVRIVKVCWRTLVTLLMTDVEWRIENGAHHQRTMWFVQSIVERLWTYAVPVVDCIVVLFLFLPKTYVPTTKYWKILDFKAQAHYKWRGLVFCRKREPYAFRRIQSSTI
jgi:hypothetical protein